jgi:hypothetical protein
MPFNVGPEILKIMQPLLGWGYFRIQKVYGGI